MNEPHDPNCFPDSPSDPGDSLDAGLAAAFGRRAEGPRSNLDASQRPVLLKDAQGESADIVKPRSDAMPTPEQTGNRYQLFGEIARGGMGAVLRGRDVDLGRDLAVKVLLEKYADHPEVAQRFIEEAQIGGQLQHPNVVPVYDLGRFGDRPFFTMKLVKGRTLAQLLAERADPTQDRPRLLSITLQVAQALAYAHAKGVIHRDLKPANVMVGAFGEVQVMDWGLAKVLAEGGIVDEERANRQHQPGEKTIIRTARSSGSSGGYGSDTEAGSLLGTPAYMPPEQAIGDVAHLDRRADVFGLGAILCEILTGKPPYVGSSPEEVRRKAANAILEEAKARLDACAADVELLGLTKVCLAPDPTKRPKDAQEVALRLTNYLSGVQERLQTAERERAVAVAREAEQRKRRKVQLALAAAVLLLLLGGGAFAWWQNAQAQAGRERDARNAEAVTALLGQAEEALKANDAAKAAVALDAARKRSAEGGAQEQAHRLGRLDADLALLRELDSVNQFCWTPVEGRLPDLAVVATRTRAALWQFGADPDAVPVDEAAARIIASVGNERIVMALDRLLWKEKTAGVHAVLRQVDADPYRDVVRDAILANDPAKVVALAEQKGALEQPSGFVAFLGEIRAIPVERRRQLLEAAVNRWPGDLGLLMTLGGTYPIGQEDGANERLRWFQAALAAAPDNPTAHGCLGEALRDKAQWDQAIKCYHKAIALAPRFAAAHNGLGNVLKDKGQLDDAIECYDQAIALAPKSAGAHNGLGNALRDKGQLDDAIESYLKAIELAPNNAMVHNNLGNALKDKGQVEEAIQCYCQAIALDPRVAGFHSNLGQVLKDRGQVDEAIRYYRQAIALDPKDARIQNTLGILLCDVKRDYDGAIDRFQKAIALDPKFALAHYNLGNARTHKGQLDEAIDSIQKALELEPNYAEAHYNLGNAWKYKGQMNKAMECYRKATECDPKHAEAHCNLGQALADQGRFAEAVVALRRGHEVGSKRSDWRYRSAEWVRRAEANATLEAKLPAFFKGEFQPGDNQERLALAFVCLVKKLPHAATGLYASAFAADPRLADDLQAHHRYYAACCAALAGTGQGKDAAPPDDRERVRLRQQALDWFQADLTALGKFLDSGNPQARSFLVQVLSHWQKDPDLASIRDKAALAKLPVQEQKAFAQLWADVAATLQKADQAKE